jgi:hypothetical protein
MALNPPFGDRISERPFSIPQPDMIPTFKRVVRRSHHISTHDEIDDLLDYLTMPSLERGTIAKISRDTGIPFQTLRDWRQLRATDPDWFPLANGQPKARAFDPKSEATIADFVRHNYIRPGTGARRTDLKHLCLDCYAAQDDDERHLERFCASTTFTRATGPTLWLRRPARMMLSSCSSLPEEQEGSNPSIGGSSANSRLERERNSGGCCGAFVAPTSTTRRAFGF